MADIDNEFDIHERSIVSIIEEKYKFFSCVITLYTPNGWDPRGRGAYRDTNTRDVINKFIDSSKKDNDSFTMSSYLSDEEIWSMSILFGKKESLIKISQIKDIEDTDPIKTILEKKITNFDGDVDLLRLFKNTKQIERFYKTANQFLEQNVYYYFIRASVKNIAFGRTIIISTPKPIEKNDVIVISSLLASSIAPQALNSREKESTKSAIAAIMSRNMSHNLGSHVISGTKNYLVNKEYELSPVENRGMHRLLQYLQERMDFISVIINTSSNGYTFDAPLNLKADILDEIAADGRDKRHNQGENKKQTKSFLLDYIVRSEDIVRDGANDKTKLELMLLLEKNETKPQVNNNSAIASIMSRNMSHNLGSNIIKNTKIYSFSSEANGDNDANDFNSIEFSVPFGINSRHAFLTIIENYIRNSAKHNKNACNDNTLLVSIWIQEKDDKYIITIFDNKEQVSDNLFDGKKHLQESIKILNDDNTLNTDNKGIKEMLICSAWLNREYEDWSIIESKSGKNQELLDYGPVYLSDIRKGIEKSIEEESNPQRIEEKKKRLAYYGADKTALGIRFELSKHKYVHYAKVSDVSTVYGLPSADFYVIELAGETVTGKDIEYILPNVVIVSVQSNNNSYTVFEKDKNEQLYEFKIEIEENIDVSKEINKKINNKDFLLKCYQAKHDYERDRKILINYDIKDDDKYNDEIKNVIRTQGEIDNAGLRNSKVYVFSRHNDVPSIFPNFYEKLQKLHPSHLFLEGISGGSYNYNLLINAPIRELEFYKIIHSCDVKIGIVDERLYDKYRELKFAAVVNDCNIEKFNDEIKNHQGKASELSDECYDFLYDYVVGDLRDRHTRIEEFLKKQNRIDTNQSYNCLYTEKKGIYIYNYDSKKKSLVNLDGYSMKINPEIKFLSIHYGILDKYEEGDKDINKKYWDFIKQIIPEENREKVRVILHSGRGGVVKIADEITFVPLSTIESCMDDCKYKLAQLFLNLKYKKPNKLWQMIENIS